MLSKSMKMVVKALRESNIHEIDIAALKYQFGAPGLQLFKGQLT